MINKMIIVFAIQTVSWKQSQGYNKVCRERTAERLDFSKFEIPSIKLGKSIIIVSIER